MKQVFRQIIKNVLKFLVIMQTISCVSSILESMCFSPGYVNFIKDPTKVVGPQDTGWNRLYPISASWSHAFWAIDDTFTSDNSGFQWRLRFLEDKNTPGTILSGWLQLEFSKSNYPFHYLAVWAVTESNEVYGNFILDQSLRLDSCSSAYYLGAYSYIPCSAAPINSATVPNTFVYANLAMTRDRRTGNFESVNVHNGLGQNRLNGISLVWRAPAQTYCQRPEKFRFIIITSGVTLWESAWNVDWSNTSKHPYPRPSSMLQQSIWGPIINYTEWIHPHYFGHPSRHDTSQALICKGIISGKEWIKTISTEPLESFWTRDMLWLFTMDGNWNDPDVLQRSTCKGHAPNVDEMDGFAGRCNAKVKGKDHVVGSMNALSQCTDSSSSLGQSEFKMKYQNYLQGLKERAEGTCECLVVETPPGGSAVTARSIVVRSLPIFSSVLKVRSLNISGDSKAADIERNEECSLQILKIESKFEQNKAGICIHSKVGKLVYGLRQWHGVTSLCVALIITPLSIFIARYNKGEMVLIEGKVPLKGWYISHILLVFPAIWMYASGVATMTRQKDVLGQSYSPAAKFHRNLGIVTFLLIPFQFITGFLRPKNIPMRKVVIYIHWAGGMTQHILELLLCILSSQIPGSPTSSKSLVNPQFGSLSSSIVGCLIIGWFGFMTLFQILLMIRLKRQDILDGVRARSLFPIIVPLFSTVGIDDLDLGHHHRDIWFERGALLIFSLVSLVILVVSIVSLYQELYDNLYYGFGPMSCTHTLKGFLINSSDGESSCNSM